MSMTPSAVLKVQGASVPAAAAEIIEMKDRPCAVVVGSSDKIIHECYFYHEYQFYNVPCSPSVKESENKDDV
ncbi:hypothetical protein BG000_005714, partial [Podila horticola]